MGVQARGRRHPGVWLGDHDRAGGGGDLKRLFAAIEGNQVDEISLITEVQWRFLPRAVLKLNSGWGLTQNATDFAPEVGIMFSF